jgi:hypothetical protein
LYWINFCHQSGAERSPRSIAIKKESARLLRRIFEGERKIIFKPS